VIQWFVAGDKFSLTCQQIRPSILVSILSNSGQLILDVRSITHDAGTDNAETTSTDPKGTYIKALLTSDPVVRGRGHVLTHF